MKHDSDHSPDVIAAHQLTPEEYGKIVEILGREPSLHRARHLLRDVERALLLQELAPASEEASDARQAASCRARAKTPASSTSATASPSRSRSSRTITRASSSRSRARPPASAASCATSSRWARGRIAVLNALRFGPLDDPETGARNARILEGVVAGIAHYGNCFGVPTVGGECVFEDCYARQSAGERLRARRCRARTRSSTARPTGPAIPLSMSARRPDATASTAPRWPRPSSPKNRQQKRPNVQVGDPFMEKLLLEACLEAMQTGAIVGIQDMGAAG